jgi:hypothetical protein
MGAAVGAVDGCEDMVLAWASNSIKDIVYFGIWDTIDGRILWIRRLFMGRRRGILRLGGTGMFE